MTKYIKFLATAIMFAACLTTGCSSDSGSNAGTDSQTALAQATTTAATDTEPTTEASGSGNEVSSDFIYRHTINVQKFNQRHADSIRIDDRFWNDCNEQTKMLNERLEEIRAYMSVNVCKNSYDSAARALSEVTGIPWRYSEVHKMEGIFTNDNYRYPVYYAEIGPFGLKIITDSTDMHWIEVVNSNVGSKSYALNSEASDNYIMGGGKYETSNPYDDDHIDFVFNSADLINARAVCNVLLDELYGMSTLRIDEIDAADEEWRSTFIEEVLEALKVNPHGNPPDMNRKIGIDDNEVKFLEVASGGFVVIANDYILVQTPCYGCIEFRCTSDDYVVSGATSVGVSNSTLERIASAIFTVL